MTPLTTPEQFVVHTRLEVTPTPWASTYRDYWGTEVTSFEVHDQHSELTVIATSIVQVNRPAQEPRGPRLGRAPDRRGQRPVLRDLRGRRPGAPRRRARARWSRGWPRAVGPERLRAARSAELVRDEMTYVRAPPRCTTTRRTPGRPADRRLPGLRARRARRAACRRRAGALRVGLPAPDARAAWSARRSWGSRTRGSSGGTASGSASTRPTTSRPATGTSWSPAAATTATCPPLTGIFSGGTTSIDGGRGAGHPAVLSPAGSRVVRASCGSDRATP